MDTPASLVYDRPMDLTRYWRASHEKHQIEVQWTGMRLTGGWRLSLLVDRRLQAESGSRSGDILIQGAAGTEPISVRLQGGVFRNRCTISAGETVLENSTQPWNALAFLVVCGVAPILGLLLTYGFVEGFDAGSRADFVEGYKAGRQATGK